MWEKTFKHGIFKSDSYYTWKLVLLADESSNEDEPEEARFLLEKNLNRLGMYLEEASSVPALAENEAQGLLTQVFPLPF